ncbi:hypothetical protein QEN19_000274 [Hanseniaspora menglaensis]
MPLRNLSEVEKLFAQQTIQSKRNGIISASVYTCLEEEDMLKEETATLTSIKSLRVAGGPECHLIKKALKMLIHENEVLQVCVNKDLKFDILSVIEFDDVFTKLDFDSLIDEKLSCYHSLPLPLLKEIFNKMNFDFEKPLWRVYVVDENMIIFHGNECLFDNFSMMILQKKMQECLIKVKIQSKEKLDMQDKKIIFKSSNNSSVKFSKSIYDSGKLYIPSVGRKIFNSQAQFFFKKIYKDVIKKPIELLTGTVSDITNCDVLSNKYNDLCGNTVFGNLNVNEYNNLKQFLVKENLSLKSFIATVAMMCFDFDLEATKNKHFVNNELAFQFPFNIRKNDPSAQLDTLNFKNITIACPLKFATDKNFIEYDFYNCYDANNVRFPLDDPEFKEKLLDFNFEQISELFESSLNAREKAWRRCGLNDDDFKRMKMMASDNFVLAKAVEINDLTEFNLEMPLNSNYLLKDLFFIKSANPQNFISISLTTTTLSGLSISITYPDGYELDDFVIKFEATLRLKQQEAAKSQKKEGSKTKRMESDADAIRAKQQRKAEETATKL